MIQLIARIMYTCAVKRRRNSHTLIESEGDGEGASDYPNPNPNPNPNPHPNPDPTKLTLTLTLTLHDSPEEDASGNTSSKGGTTKVV